MGLTYFKRYKMEVRLSQLDLRPLELGPGLELKAWAPGLLASTRW